MKSLNFVLVLLLVAGPILAAGLTPDAATLREVDGDGNRLADALEDSLQVLHALGKGENEIRIIALLKGQPGKQNRQLIAQAGGAIEYVYRNVLNGLAIHLPAGEVRGLANRLGDQLVLLELDGETRGAMDTTMPQLRVRPHVWSPLSQGGYNLLGDGNTTIGVIDTGIDISHPDLADRLVFWHDFHQDSEPEPVDFSGHGTAVAGLLGGSGASLGLDPITHLTHTQAGPYFPNMDYSLVHYIPILGAGVVTMDQLISGSGQACIGFGPLGSPLQGPFCSTNGLIFQNFSFDSPGYFLCNYTSGSFSGTMESSNLVTTPYAQHGDGFPLFQGMAPGCNLATFKVMNGEGLGSGSVSSGIAAMVPWPPSLLITISKWQTTVGGPTLRMLLSGRPPTALRLQGWFWWEWPTTTIQG